ncbi:DUF6153 family protein [Micromonospora sp. 4G57]|uniref:DUF6153 family protein n=1 Tax=Micromonospora sicca TaxID=2202420 RepID=A0ABU5JNY7_9ACTN|nr:MULTISPECIES: DUF6153 family protein [unclassified Micromonospora]MDZ5447585.1 DUF6153 family protein [Micromonospora sp. 4G57]MDZ5494363.1 DUF6153 family protein [Micromonospora sp. 4G53]
MVLLVVLAFGVVGMHTFGHAGDAGHRGSGDHPATAERAALMVVTDAKHETAHQPATGRIIDATTGGGMGGGLFAVCLAVLGALGLVLWAAVTRGHARGDLLRLRPAGRALASGRGPPVRRLGLRMAAVSVLRM